jgi:tRNA-splicing ligase RtcB
MVSELKTSGVPVKLWTKIEEVESGALDQLKRVASLPWVAHHVAVMPDVHVGKGATVGSVVAMRGAVAPAAVGVDIGCGMAAIPTNLGASDLPDSLKALRSAIEAAIPVGFSAHDRPVLDAVKKGDLALANEIIQLLAGFGDLTASVGDQAKKVSLQLGTLGGGNHFIELCVATDDKVWLMLHSGSRNIGKCLAEIHMAKARTLEHNQALKDRDLAVFLAGTPEMAAYRRDLFWAQEYARLNRAAMLHLYRQVMGDFFPKVRFGEAVFCHHNYVAEETHFGEALLVTRKGAIRAGRGELGIIPGSMGAKSFIVRGKGHADAFESAAHGAGRKMSRGKAKERFTTQDLREQTAGVECRKDAGVVDEIPGAYKNIDKVMAHQAELVEIVAELKQVLCVKG